MLGPTTGTGNEKRRTLRKSVPSNSPRNVSQSWLGPISFLFLKWWMEARYQSSFPCDRKKSDPAKRVQPVLPANIFQEMAKKQIGDCNFRSLLYLTNNYHTGTGNEKRRTLRKSVPSNIPRRCFAKFLSCQVLKWWMEARYQSSSPGSLVQSSHPHVTAGRKVTLQNVFSQFCLLTYSKKWQRNKLETVISGVYCT